MLRVLVRPLSPNHPNQSPIVTLKCDKTELDLPRGEFDFVSRRWDVSINQTIEICSEMTVTGVPIVLNGCSVADLSAPIFRKRCVSISCFEYDLAFQFLCLML